MKKITFKASGEQSARRLRVGIMAVLLTAILWIPLHFLADGVIAAHRLSEYAASVYNVKSTVLYARYNPVSPARYIVIPQGDGAGSITLMYENNGDIYDAGRGDSLLADMGFPERFAQQNDADHRQFGYLRCCWKYDLPDEPVITLHIQIRESNEPFPGSDAEILKIMAERFRLYYDILQTDERESLDCVKVIYQHYAQRKDQKDNDQYTYSVYVEMAKTEESAEEMILSANLVKTANRGYS